MGVGPAMQYTYGLDQPGSHPSSIQQCGTRRLCARLTCCGVWSVQPDALVVGLVGCCDYRSIS
eukprot:2244466-Pleurochrysis_carterae.AAC.2